MGRKMIKNIEIFNPVLEINFNLIWMAVILYGLKSFEDLV